MNLYDEITSKHKKKFYHIAKLLFCAFLPPLTTIAMPHSLPRDRDMLLEANLKCFMSLFALKNAYLSFDISDLEASFENCNLICDVSQPESS